VRPENAESDKPVDCFSCRHFKVTWQPAWPYMCLAMGFRSRSLPSLEVFRVDGAQCRAYLSKQDMTVSPDSAEPAPLRFSRRV
jgi:hypothetical protein